MVTLPIFPLLFQTLLYINVHNDDDAYSTKLRTTTHKPLMFDLGCMLTLAYVVGNSMKTTLRNQNCEISVRIIKAMIFEGG
jgi:hypothetical protein